MNGGITIFPSVELIPTAAAVDAIKKGEQMKIARTPDERFADLKGYPIDSERFPKSDFCCFTTHIAKQ